MAEQSLSPQNLESYSTEAISNFSKAIEDFADILTEIKSEKFVENRSVNNIPIVKPK